MSNLKLETRHLTIAMLVAGLAILAWPCMAPQLQYSRTAARVAQEGTLEANLVSSTGRLAARTRPIESLCVGDRVLAYNPEVSQSERDTFVEPDWSEWLQLSLAMPKQDGSLLEIELLRPQSWVREQMGLVVEPAESEVTEERILSPLMQSVNTDQHPSASPIAASSERAAEDAGQRDEATGVDSVPYSPLLPILRDIAFANAELQLSGEALRAIFVEMDLPELAINGEAIVLDIRGPPPIRAGAGRVITATFHHSSGDVIDLVVGDDFLPRPLAGEVGLSGPGEGLSTASQQSRNADTIGTTSNHPFWSVDRQTYVQAGQLAIGERLQTYSGDTKRVISKLARPSPQPVYNLEVFAEHVYYVGQDGLLVHNSGDRYFDGSDLSRMTVRSINELNNRTKLRKLVQGADVHHIATPYGRSGQRMGQIFANAGLDIETSPFNLVRITSHSGGHGYYNEVIEAALSSRVRAIDPLWDAAKYRAVVIDELLELRWQLKNDSLGHMVKATASPLEKIGSRIRR